MRSIPHQQPESDEEEIGSPLLSGLRRSNPDSKPPIESKKQPELVNPDEELLELIEKARLQDEATKSLFNQCVEYRWQLGKTLTEARDLFKRSQKSKEKNWKDFLEECGISVATDYRVRKLFHRFSDAKALTGMTIMEAYEEASVDPKKKKAIKDVADSKQDGSEIRQENKENDLNIIKVTEYEVKSENLIDLEKTPLPRVASLLLNAFEARFTEVEYEPLGVMHDSLKDLIERIETRLRELAA